MFVKKKFSQGAGIIFYKKENTQILVALGLRRGGHQAGFWSYAGGNLDPTDKSYFDCAIREAREEFFNYNRFLFNLIPTENMTPGKRVGFNVYFIRWDAYFVDVSNVPLVFERQKSEIDDIHWYNIKHLPSKTHLLIHYEIWVARIFNYFK
ncbi:NUDIX domain-containing protein [Aquirufa sp. A-Brett2-15D]